HDARLLLLQTQPAAPDRGEMLAGASGVGRLTEEGHGSLLRLSAASVYGMDRDPPRRRARGARTPDAAEPHGGAAGCWDGRFAGSTRPRAPTPVASWKFAAR